MQYENYWHAVKDQISVADFLDILFEKGNYFLTALNDCSVQVVYVHNTSTSLNLSISVGPVGISFDKSQHKDYRATPLSLYR